ncbi:hypothetical protein EYF80_025869 [Liparis tanakae]|uniref:Uncharacterized protein n=1 Tax=Liparis tanakae TaxID=230148 RepID=A0A4Z2HDY9_9TELE|nr:hypothetical protein EYF80_025869 [Liparis tanakae]
MKKCLWCGSADSALPPSARGVDGVLKLSWQPSLGDREVRGGTGGPRRRRRRRRRRKKKRRETKGICLNLCVACFLIDSFSFITLPGYGATGGWAGSSWAGDLRDVKPKTRLEQNTVNPGRDEGLN